MADRVDLADQAERRVGQFELRPLAVLVGGERGVQLPSGVDRGVGCLEALDLSQIEQAVTIAEVVEGDMTRRGGSCVSKRACSSFLAGGLRGFRGGLGWWVNRSPGGLGDL